MKFILKTFGATLFLYGASASTALAAGLVPCGGKGKGEKPCNDIKDLVNLVDNIIDFLIRLSPYVAAIAFAWAGFLLLTAGGDQGKIDKAKEIFGNTLVGLLWMVAAYFVVKLILSGLGAENFVYQFFQK